MNLSNIKYFSTVNGTGVRTAVFVSGCEFNCPGCFNTVAKDFNYGEPLNDELLNKILESVEPEYISGLAILGGEPLNPRNQEGVYQIIEAFRKKFGDTKTIWLWTGYVFEKVPLTGVTFDIFKSIDVLIDGPFILEKRDPKLPYRGSSNQRVIDMRKSFGSACQKIVELSGIE